MNTKNNTLLDLGIKCDFDIEFFKNKLINFCEFEPNTGCWLWTGGEQRFGYGAIAINNKVKTASRVSFILFKGPIKEGHFICHKCDTPQCCNPDHLFSGTQKDNIKDCISKKRLNRKVIYFCKNGHEFTEQNTYIAKKGTKRQQRVCRLCVNDAGKRYRRRKCQK